MNENKKYIFTHEFSESSNSYYEETQMARIEASSDDENGIWISANREGWNHLAKVCAEFSLDEKLEPGFHHKHFDAPVEVFGVENNELTFGLETWKKNDESENSESGLYVYLVITDLECDPEKLSPFMKAAPTEIARASDLYTKHGRPRVYRSNCWQYDSELKELDLDLHIKNIYEKLGSIDSIKKVSATWKTSIICVVDFRGSDNNPSLGITKESSQILSEWEADLNISYYLWGKVKGDNYKQASSIKK